MWFGSRRQFLRTSASVAAGASLDLAARPLSAQIPGERPDQDDSVDVLNPQMRVPLSLIIDDSTCLVNLNRFAIPQFALAWKGENRRFNQDWRNMPHEIPDDFVRRFGEWCGERGIQGKYSIVPYPACVGRLDRVLPGWTRRQVDDSIGLVRKLMMPHWDIHPEMVTHTWIINTKTGHPYRERSIQYMENWNWTDGRSVDELADYMSYALTILKNVGLPCDGITTPGGFGNRVLPELAQASWQAVRDVFNAEIPHYFRHTYSTGQRSVAPRVEYAAGLDGSHPTCVVSIIGCTGDWTGGWDCSRPGEVDRFITADLASGRIVEVIERGEPAIMLCHWTGIYFNGEEVGFQTFQEAVRRIHAKYDHVTWMKLSEIARYWAAKELTRIARKDADVSFDAPFACPRFTCRIRGAIQTPPKIWIRGEPATIKEASGSLQLRSGMWLREKQDVILCFDLPKGKSTLQI